MWTPGLPAWGGFMQSVVDFIRNKIENQDGAVKNHLQDVLDYIDNLEQKPLTTGEVAKICAVAMRTVSVWFDKGILKGYRVPSGKDRRILIRDLRSFMIKYEIPIELLDKFLARRKK